MIRIRPMIDSDADEVLCIYQEGIHTGHATFETSTPTWIKWDTGHLTCCRLVAVEAEIVVGWAALSPVSDRCCYAGVADLSIYVAESARGKGVGQALLQTLIEESEEAGLWTLTAGVFPENSASLALHSGNGFRIIGRRERIGQLNGIWRDTLLLERRSCSVGQ